MKKVYCKDCEYLRAIHDIWYDSNTCKKNRELRDGLWQECDPEKINKDNNCDQYEKSGQVT